MKEIKDIIQFRKDVIELMFKNNKLIKITDKTAKILFPRKTLKKFKEMYPHYRYKIFCSISLRTGKSFVRPRCFYTQTFPKDSKIFLPKNLKNNLQVDTIKLDEITSIILAKINFILGFQKTFIKKFNHCYKYFKILELENKVNNPVHSAVYKFRDSAVGIFLYSRRLI